MPVLESLGQIANLATVAIRAARDPSWSQETQRVREAHLARLSAWARASREWTAALSGKEIGALAVGVAANRVRDVLLQELSAGGEYLGERPGVREPTLAIPVSVLDSIFIALSARRRDAELGANGATLGTVKN